MKKTLLAIGITSCLLNNTAVTAAQIPAISPQEELAYAI